MFPFSGAHNIALTTPCRTGTCVFSNDTKKNYLCGIAKVKTYATTIRPTIALTSTIDSALFAKAWIPKNVADLL